MEIYTAKLQSEYYPNVLRNLPISPELRYLLLEIVILERKYSKRRGERFDASAAQLADIYGCTPKKMREYLKELKAKRLIDYDQVGRRVYYCICWPTIEHYIRANDIKV